MAEQLTQKEWFTLFSLGTACYGFDQIHKNVFVFWVVFFLQFVQHVVLKDVSFFLIKILLDPHENFGLLEGFKAP